MKRPLALVRQLLIALLLGAIPQILAIKTHPQNTLGPLWAATSEPQSGEPLAASEPTDCTQIQLAEDSALPLREMAILGLPATMITNNPGGGAYLRDASGSIQDVVLTYYPDRELSTFSIPLLNDGMEADAPLTLHIVDADDLPLCPPQPFRILPLPASPGAYSAAVDSLGQYLAAQRREQQISREDLHPTSTTPLSVEQYALALVHYAYDDPDNPNSMVRIAEGSAPILQSGEFEADYLDRLMAATQLDAYMRQQVASLSAARSSNPPLISSTGSSEGLLRVDIEDFEVLRDYMLKQQAAEGYFGTATQPTMFGNVFNDVAVANSLAGLVTGPYGLAIGTFMYSFKLGLEATTHRLPSQITDLELDYTAEITEEDDDQTYTYSNFRVTASSYPWDISYAVVDGVLLFTGSLRGVGGKLGELQPISLGRARLAGPASQPLTVQNLTLSERVIQAGTLGGTAGDVVQVGAEVGSNLGSRVDQNLVVGSLILPPYTWENIPVPYEWLSAPDMVAFNTTPAVRITNSSRGEYRAWNASNALMRFRLTIGERVFSLTKPVRTQAIEINWNLPTVLSINEGERVCLDITVNNARDRRGILTISGPQIDDRIPIPSQPLTPECFQAPAKIGEEWTTPLLCSLEPRLMPEFYTVEFESTAGQGARDRRWNPSWERRSVYSIIQVQPLPDNHANAVPPPRDPRCGEDNNLEEEEPQLVDQLLVNGFYDSVVVERQGPNCGAFKPVGTLDNEPYRFRFFSNNTLEMSLPIAANVRHSYQRGSDNLYRVEFPFEGEAILHTLTITSPTSFSVLTEDSYVGCTVLIEYALDQAYDPADEPLFFGF